MYACVCVHACVCVTLILCRLYVINKIIFNLLHVINCQYIYKLFLMLLAVYLLTG